MAAAGRARARVAATLADAAVNTTTVATAIRCRRHRGVPRIVSVVELCCLIRIIPSLHHLLVICLTSLARLAGAPDPAEIGP